MVRIVLQYIINKKNITLALTVSIQVDYPPPFDFHLPSPPYYRPASSVSLTCVVHDDVVGDVSYLWFSTNTDSFVNGATEETIYQELLTGFDAGNHTCTVTDEMGNTGSAHTTMKLYGKMIMSPIVCTWSSCVINRCWNTVF